MRMVIALLVWSLAFAAQEIEADKLVLDARKQVGVTLSYDPAYRKLSYPGGDVPMATGVCTDVVIRALRQQGLDLQESVHRDMRGNFAVYPKHWGVSRPDSNIDHRRVPNLMTWFKRQGWSLPVKQDASAYRAGDIVTWDLGRGLTHIGIVSDRQAATGTPLVLHNIGRGTQEEDILFAYRITGHYRPLAQQARAGQ
ncbi:DUF1287 domain-containing protein [Ectopseudomonas mendocina]|nr:DUF1287 domain-containing protein [Pseudomonas mendocina]TRO22063.1 DUF1287 domain-containing protein [Pseudomonas mendocina]TRO29429.1 DUF1287 domain-containing protein [Pseudomonas mendocina]